MATATEVKLCPRCEEALPHPKPARCPSCNASLAAKKKPEAGIFECPDYLWFQKGELTKPSARKPGQRQSPEEEKRLLTVAEDLGRFVKEADADTLSAALFDAHLVMSTVLHAKIAGTSLKKIVETAKAIGRLGETIDQYIKAGGGINDERESGEAG